MVRDLYFVQLTVADCRRSLAWYRDALGLGVVMTAEADGFALLSAGGTRVAIKEGRPEPGAVLLAFEVDDLAGELRRLAAAGIEPEAPPQASPEGYRRAVVRDPDGHRLCLFEWLPANQASRPENPQGGHRSV